MMTGNFLLKSHFNSQQCKSISSLIQENLKIQRIKIFICIIAISIFFRIYHFIQDFVLKIIPIKISQHIQKIMQYFENWKSVMTKWSFSIVFHLFASLSHSLTFSVWWSLNISLDSQFQFVIFSWDSNGLVNKFLVKSSFA